MSTTSGKEENILLRHRANSGTGSCQDSSRDIHEASENEHLATVEVSAPAEVEEIVPWQWCLGEQPP
jgi:hypothetical protein